MGREEENGVGREWGRKGMGEEGNGRKKGKERIRVVIIKKGD